MHISLPGLLQRHCWQNSWMHTISINYFLITRRDVNRTRTDHTGFQFLSWWLTNNSRSISTPRSFQVYFTSSNEETSRLANGTQKIQTAYQEATLHFILLYSNMYQITCYLNKKYSWKVNWYNSFSSYLTLENEQMQMKPNCHQRYLSSQLRFDQCLRIVSRSEY